MLNRKASFHRAVFARRLRNASRVAELELQKTRPTCIAARNALRGFFLMILGSALIFLSPALHGSENALDTEIVLDCENNVDAPGIDVVGNWIVGNNTAQHGTRFLRDGGTAATEGKAVEFTPNLPVTGSYRIYLWWRTDAAYASNSAVKIKKDGVVVDERTVNQQANGGRWFHVGTYKFDAGQRSAVRISNSGANGQVVADAVRFSLVTPEVIVDDADTANISKVGNWSTLTGTAPNGGTYLSCTSPGVAEGATPTASVTYTATLPVRGIYDVYVQWRTPDTGASTRVPGTVTRTENGVVRSDPIVINQTDPSGLKQRGFEWVTVGRFLCDAVSGGPVTCNVAITNAAGVNTTVNMDAVRFRRVAETDVILDNSDIPVSDLLPSGPAWPPGDIVNSGQYAHNYRADDRTASGPRLARFTTTLPKTGSYAVYLWWKRDTAGTHASSVPVNITHATGIATVYAPMRTGGGGWWYAGTWNFNSGVTARVELSSAGTNGNVIADAVCFLQDADSDWDGMLDAWEIQTFRDLTTATATSDFDRDGISDLEEYKDNTNPKEYYNGRVPQLTKITGDNLSGPPSTFLPSPANPDPTNFQPEQLTVKITDDAGALMKYAPVVFKVTQGDGLLSANAHGLVAFTSELPTLYTNSEGLVSAYFANATDYPATSRIQVRAGPTQTVEFTATTTPLVAYWPFNETPGVSEAKDYSRARNHATVKPGAAITQQGGFDGSNGLNLNETSGGYIESAHYSSLDLKTSPFTIFGWVRLANGVPLFGDNDIYGVLSKGAETGAGLEIAIAGGIRNGFWVRLSNGTSVASLSPNTDQSALFRDGRWHHFAVIRDTSGTLTLYLDGMQSGSVAGGGINIDNSMPLKIGARRTAGGTFKGGIDELRITREALLPAQIEAYRNQDLQPADGISDWWTWRYFGGASFNGAADSDGDGISNQQEYIGGTDPTNYYNARSVELTKTLGDRQIGAPGELLPQPLAVDVHTRPPSIQPLYNAPVRFSTSANQGQIGASPGAQNLSTSLEIRSAKEGEVAISKAYLKLPSTEGADVSVTATGADASTTFTAWVRGLASHLKFDEESGTHAQDSTGHGRTGALLNGLARGIGPNGSPDLKFDGTDDLLAIENAGGSVLLPINAPFTISFWLKSDFVNVSSGLLTTRSTTLPASGFSLALSGGKLAIWSDDAGGSIPMVRSIRTVADIKWHNVAIAYTGSEVKLYLDGKLVGIGAGQIVPNDHEITIGGGFSGWNAFRGSIDELKFHRGIELTATQIDAAHQSELRIVDSDQDGLSNWEEINTWHTDPDLADTDGDKISDGQEVINGTDPTRDAASWNVLDIYITAGRAGHEFAVETSSGIDGAVSNLGLIEGDATFGTFTSLRAPLTFSSTTTLVDLTTGDRLSFEAPRDPELVDLRGFRWGRRPGSNPSRQYFLMGPDRIGHAFLLAQPSGAFHLATPGVQINAGTVDPGAATARIELSAPFDPQSEFWIVDITTGERSVQNVTNLATTTWSANEDPLPVRQVYLFLDPHEAGRDFTISSRVPGSSQQSVTVVRAESLQCSTGGWLVGTMDEEKLHTFDHSGTEVTISEGASYVAVSIGVGMEFWITRNEGTSPTSIAQVGSEETPVWILYGHFENEPPARNWEEITFQLPGAAIAEGIGRFSVRHTDGLQSGPPVSHVTGYFHSYDDFGELDERSTPFVRFSLWVDTNQEWWLVDSLHPEKYYAAQTTNFVEWSPTHAAPPGGSMWLQIFGGRQGHSLKLHHGFDVWPILTMMPQLLPINLSNGGIAYVGGAGQRTHTVLNEAGDILYSYPYFQVSVPYTAPNLYDPPGEFTVVDQTSGETAVPNKADLRDWFPKPATKLLSISSSRFGHNLYLCHPNGDQFKIQQNAIQGNYSLDPTQTSWFNSYYYFEANAQWRDFLDWWIEDRTAGDSTPKASSFEGTGQMLEETLIDWIALPQPIGLTATVSGTPAIVKLTWQPNGAANDGSFIVERKATDSESWQSVAVVPAVDPDQDGDIEYSDTVVVNAPTFSYRVKYAFGEKYSAASAPVQVAGFPDTDGDGISDYLEIFYGRNPSSSEDGEADTDGDGTSDLNEILGGRNPLKRDAASLQLSVFGVTAP